MVGLVRAIISAVGVSSGVIRKYTVELIRLMTTCVPKRISARRSSRRSLTAREYPIVMIPLISGDISIAPIITAVEFMFSPMEAISAARHSIHMLGPWITVFSSIISSISS